MAGFFIIAVGSPLFLELTTANRLHQAIVHLDKSLSVMCVCVCMCVCARIILRLTIYIYINIAFTFGKKVGPSTFSLTSGVHCVNLYEAE